MFGPNPDDAVRQEIHAGTGPGTPRGSYSSGELLSYRVVVLRKLVNYLSKSPARTDHIVSLSVTRQVICICICIYIGIITHIEASNIENIWPPGGLCPVSRRLKLDPNCCTAILIRTNKKCWCFRLQRIVITGRSGGT